MRAGRGEHLGRDIDQWDDHYLGLAGTDVVATEALLVLRDNLAGGAHGLTVTGAPRNGILTSPRALPRCLKPDERPRANRSAHQRIELYDGRARQRARDCDRSAWPGLPGQTASPANTTGEGPPSLLTRGGPAPVSPRSPDRCRSNST